MGAANVVSINTSRRWLKGNGTLEIDPETNSSASSYNILPWSGNYNEGEDSFYREVIRENYELDNPEDYLDDDFEADWQFDTGTLQVTDKYRTQAAYSGTRDEWCDQNHYYDYFYGNGFDLPASSYTDTWNFDNIYAEDSDILYALTESLLASSASGSGSGSGSGENSLSLDVLSGSATTLISNKVQTSTVWDDMDYSYTDDDGMAVSGTEDSTARYTYHRDMQITEKYVGSASVTPASGEFLDDGWLVRGSGKISETSSENGSYSGSASYDYTPDYYTYSSASGSYTESGDWRDNYSNKLTLTYKQSSDPTGDDYWHVKGTENGVSGESYEYSLSADQTFTWDVYSGTQNESGNGSYRTTSHYKATYDNEQSDEWTLASGSGSATEDYHYDSALSASGSYSMSMENGSASIYGTSASNDSLTWHDRTEYKYSVVDGEWQTDMTGKTTQTETSGSSYIGSGSGSGSSGDATSGNTWSASASEEGAFLQTEVTKIDWSLTDGSYSATGNIHTDYDASGMYAFSSENDFWWNGYSSEGGNWNSHEDISHNERESNETMVFHHERNENYEWSMDETGRVYVSDYDYTQTGSMSANGHRGGNYTYNYEYSNYTHGDGWSSFYHSGSYGSSNFYDDYDFTANWSESFDGVTEVYSSAHSASNDIEGNEYNLSGYFSDYYNTYSGQSPDSGGYSDSYPSSNPYASTTSSPGFNFTWSGWDVNCRQGVYLHNYPYSNVDSIPYGLGSWSNPVETPSTASPSTPETPPPYTSPSQAYVDDIDDFFYGYDNSDLYETGLQDYGEITVTNASGSASYSSYESFHSDFVDGSLGNTGVGSGLTETQKYSVGSAVSETITDGDETLTGATLTITCSYAASANGGNAQTQNNRWWSPYRWLWTGDGHASDEVLEAALTAAGNSYFENAQYAHAGLNAVSYVDPTGLAETTNQALYDMEEGKNLAQIGANAAKNITYDRVVDKVAGKIPTPGGNPSDKVGFAGKAKKESGSAKKPPTPSAGNVRKINEWEIEEFGINAHDLKHETLGRNANISHYDIAVDTSKKTAEGYELIIIPHRPSNDFSSIPTGVFIKKD